MAFGQALALQYLFLLPQDSHSKVTYRKPSYGLDILLNE